MFKSAKEHLGFNDYWLLLIGIPFVTLIVNLLTFGYDVWIQNPFGCGLIALMFTVAYWFTFRYLLIIYHKRFKDSYRFDRERLGYIIIRLIVFYVVVKFGMMLIVYGIFPGQQEFYDNNKLSGYSSEISEILVIALVFFIYEGIYYFNKSRMIEIEKNQLQKVSAEQKLNTLKNQVNPHFLFNSLNTLVTIIPENQEQAVTFVHELSKTYRTILEVRDEKLITIQKELEALDSYIYLLKTRFQGKIIVKNTIPRNFKNQFVLPISLQILIENAVKHNIVSKSKPLLIELFVEDDFLVVKNNLQLKDQMFETTKVGLTNIRARYKFMTKKEVIVEESKEEFIVKLPIIKNAKS